MTCKLTTWPTLGWEAEGRLLETERDSRRFHEETFTTANDPTSAKQFTALKDAIRIKKRRLPVIVRT